MRKWIFGLLLTLTLLLLALPALAQSYVLDSLYASVDVPETYVVLTPDNVADYADWLQARNTTSEDTINDMLARGVLLQCWNTDGDACFEVTATQDDQSTNIYDINEQSTTLRAQYRLSHYPDNDLISKGFEFSSADWKKTAGGRFLILRYIYRENGQIDHRGLMRRTIRNGYEITLDMQIYGRSVTNKDNTNLNKIWDTFTFIEVQPLPPAASAKINITDAPPQETNEAAFTFAGTAAEGVQLTAVVMGLSYPDPMVTNVTVGASGKFKMPITLPKEGVFMVTVTADYQGEDVMELAYPVTYQRTLLTVNLLTEIPELVSADVLTVRGTATPKADLQVFLNDVVVYHKKVGTDGKFSVDLDTSEEGSFNLVLTFSKQGLTDRRLSYTFTRNWTDEDMLKSLQAQAIKPGYSTLVSKIAGYDGRIMGYKCYVVDVAQAGSDWIIKMALSKKSSGYTSIILVISSSEPDVTVDSQVMMYGRSVGMSVPEEATGDAAGSTTVSTSESYPTFELLLLTSI
ncbi:MAG: hypothetical protein LLF96_10485 [Eubacteriales bacterium]|nr:hypothetical protein [Eubacteriales bacterium]